MASGKQTSFQYGEVSPEQHFRSNDAAYANALHTLRNMHVRRTGGVKRIPGFKLSAISSNQGNIPLGEISYQRTKYFAYPIKQNGVKYLTIMTLSIDDDDNSDQVTIRVGSTVRPGIEHKVNSGVGLAHVKFTYAKEKIFIHGLKVSDGTGTYRDTMVIISRLNDEFPYVSPFYSPSIPPLSDLGFSSIVGYGNAKYTDVPSLFSAVQYMITEETTEGETVVMRFETDGYDGLGFLTGVVDNTRLIYPGNGIVTGFKIQRQYFKNIAAKIKSFKVYRAKITDTTNAIGNMELVAKMPQDGSQYGNPPSEVDTVYITLVVNDSGASVPTETPPIDLSVFTNYSILTALMGTSCSEVYQQRHIVGFDFDGNPNISPGDMAVTALGSSVQFARPLISKDIGAFSMSIPIKDGSPVRSMISAERLICFSDNGAYVIQGGDNGILTPTTVNPIQISSEGGSRYVNPIIIGSTVVYLNASHTKLMAVVFGQQSQTSVVELTSLSAHLLKGEDFTELSRLPGPDNVALLLKLNGDLVAININDDYIAGCSEIIIGSKVETMTLSGEIGRETLVLSCINNGVRFNKTIADSGELDKYRVGANTDAAVITGSFLLKKNEKGYPKIGIVSDLAVNAKSNISYQYINITTDTDYNAGSTIKLSSETEFGAGFISSDRIKFFFDDNGEERYVYITLLDTGTLDGLVYTYTARADIDIPEILQDAENNTDLNSSEKLEITSRWLKAFSEIDSFFYAVGLWALYLILKKGSTIDPLDTPDGEVEVAVRADNRVMSSPLNPHTGASLKIVKTASRNPHIILPEPVTIAEVGIPFESYMESLAIEAGEGRTLTDDNKIVDKVGIALYNTVGGFVGLPDQNTNDMSPIKTRDSLDFSKPDMGYNGYVAPVIASRWTEEGRIKIKQVDPSPMTVLSIYPKGLAGD